MYFPYIYGRQAELNAISDLAGELGKPQAIFPLIEPVDAAPKLLATLDALKAEGQTTYLVVNPSLGGLADVTAQTVWLSDAASYIADSSLVIPVFKELSTTIIADIAAFAHANKGRRIGLILTTSRLLPSDVKVALGAADFLVFLQADANPVTYVATLTPARTVDISDNFKPKERNKDYVGDDWLGNNHTTWSAAGRPGFADYTILPSAFKIGGGPVGAIAIHLTYEDGPNTRVQHFVSATNDQKMPQSLKFSEALNDIHTQIAVTPTRFRSSPGLDAYETQRKSGAFTNLSGNKRQQVSHHIFTIGKHLGI